jgi:hypothetical protein
MLDIIMATKVNVFLLFDNNNWQKNNKNYQATIFHISINKILGYPLAELNE